MRRLRAFVWGAVLAGAIVMLFASPANADDCARLVKEKGQKAIISNPQVIQDCLRTGANWGWILAGAVGGTGIAVGLAGIPGTEPHAPPQWMDIHKSLCDEMHRRQEAVKQLEEQIQKEDENFVLLYQIAVAAHKLVNEGRMSWIKARLTRQWAGDSAVWLAFVSGGAWVFSAFQGVSALSLTGAAAAEMMKKSALANLSAAVTATGSGATAMASSSSWLPSVDIALARLDAEDAEIDRLYNAKVEELKLKKKARMDGLDKAKKEVEQSQSHLRDVEAKMDKDGVVFAPCT